MRDLVIEACLFEWWSCPVTLALYTSYLVRRRLECMQKSRHLDLRSWSYRWVADWRMLNWNTVIKLWRWRLKSARLLTASYHANLLDAWSDELISDTRSGLFITCDQCVFAKCQMNASQVALHDRSFWSNVVVYSMRVWWWFERVCLVQSDNLSLRLSDQYLTTTECAILKHTCVQWEVFYATLKWCVFQLYQPKLNQQNNIELDHSKSERIRSFWWSRT